MWIFLFVLVLFQQEILSDGLKTQSVHIINVRNSINPTVTIASALISDPRINSPTSEIIATIKINDNKMRLAANNPSPTEEPTQKPLQKTFDTIPITIPVPAIPTFRHAKEYVALVIVIVASSVVGLFMFILLAIIVSVKRGNTCSEFGMCAHCCGEPQGACCLNSIDKSCTPCALYCDTHCIPCMPCPTCDCPPCGQPTPPCGVESCVKPYIDDGLIFLEEPVYPQYDDDYQGGSIEISETDHTNSPV